MLRTRRAAIRFRVEDENNVRTGSPAALVDIQCSLTALMNCKNEMLVKEMLGKGYASRGARKSPRLSSNPVLKLYLIKVAETLSCQVSRAPQKADICKRWRLLEVGRSPS